MGTETGFLVKGTTIVATLVDPKNLDTPILGKALTHAYQPVIGPVQCLAYHPTVPNLFLVGTTGGSVHLYHALQIHPLMTWEPSAVAIQGVAWGSRPCVFACTNAAGKVFIYDLVMDHNLPSHTLQTPGVLTTLAFSSQKSKLAVGGGQGTVLIWTLDAALFTPHSLDMEALFKLVPKIN